MLKLLSLKIMPLRHKSKFFFDIIICISFLRSVILAKNLIQRVFYLLDKFGVVIDLKYLAGQIRKVPSDLLTSNNFSSFQELECNRQVSEFGVHDSEFVAVETRGLHQSVELFYHEGVVDWSNKFDVTMMSWA